MVCQRGGSRGSNLNFTTGLSAGQIRKIMSHPCTSQALLMNRHTTTGFHCYEGNCRREPNPKLYPSQQSLRQHRVRAHAHEDPQETSVGRALKRKREADAEELQKRQRLEEEHVAVSHILEPEPPHPVCF